MNSTLSRDHFDLAEHIRPSSSEQQHCTGRRPFSMDLLRGELSIADYTRYLGDLSGGPATAHLVARHYGATGDQLRFYSSEEIDTLVVEADAAFTFNGAIFDQLAA